MMKKKVCGVFISYDAFVKEKPAVCDQCELKSLYSVGKIYCKIKITISTAENERLLFFLETSVVYKLVGYLFRSSDRRKLCYCIQKNISLRSEFHRNY